MVESPPHWDIPMIMYFIFSSNSSLNNKLLIFGFSQLNSMLRNGQEEEEPEEMFEQRSIMDSTTVASKEEDESDYDELSNI